MNTKTRKKVFFTAFIIYSALLIYWTLFSGGYGRTGIQNIFGVNAGDYLAALGDRGNILPFRTITQFFRGYFVLHTVSLKAFIINIVGNIAVFAPFGFFLPVIFRRQRSFFVFLGTVAAIITAIELLQLLLLTGSPDIDDLILNLFGAVLGYVSTVFAAKKIKLFE